MPNRPSRRMLAALSVAVAAGAPMSAAADTKTRITYNITGLDGTYVAFGSGTPVSGPTPTQPRDFSQIDTVTFDYTTGMATLSSSDPTAQIIWSPSQDSAVIGTDPGTVTLPVFGTVEEYTLNPAGNSYGFFLDNLSNTPTIVGLTATDGSGYKTQYGVVNFTARAPIPVSPTPEPSAWALMLVGVGLAGAAVRGRRRDATKQPS